jgi:hypothetical protein
MLNLINSSFLNSSHVYVRSAYACGCKEPCNTNVARKSNGSQEVVAFFPSSSIGNRAFSSVPDPSITKHEHSVTHKAQQFSSEDDTKVLGKVRMWRRKAKENTAGYVHGTEGKR